MGPLKVSIRTKFQNKFKRIILSRRHLEKSFHHSKPSLPQAHSHIPQIHTRDTKLNDVSIVGLKRIHHVLHSCVGLIRKDEICNSYC